MASDELRIITEFRSLNDYVAKMGKHLNQIQERIEGLEKNMKELRQNYVTFVQNNLKEMASLQENMLKKSEFISFIEHMNKIVEFSPLPTLDKSKSSTEEKSSEASSQSPNKADVKPASQ